MNTLLVLLWGASFLFAYAIGESVGARKEHESARYLLRLTYRDQIDRGALNDKLQEKDDDTR